MGTLRGLCGQYAVPRVAWESNLEAESAIHLRKEREEKIALDWETMLKKRNAMRANARQVQERMIEEKDSPINGCLPMIFFECTGPTHHGL